MRKLRGNGERKRKWSARKKESEREKELHLCSLACSKILKYGTFFREGKRILTYAL